MTNVDGELVAETVYVRSRMHVPFVETVTVSKQESRLITIVSFMRVHGRV